MSAFSRAHSLYTARVRSAALPAAHSFVTQCRCWRVVRERGWKLFAARISKAQFVVVAMAERPSGSKEEKPLGEYFKRTGVQEADLNRCGAERKQPHIREGRPLQTVANWVKDNDFAGATVLAPQDDMERLEKEMRAVIAELERGAAEKQPAEKPLDRLSEDLAKFWNDHVRLPMPPMDAPKSPTIAPPKFVGKKEGAGRGS